MRKILLNHDDEAKEGRCGQPADDYFEHREAIGLRRGYAGPEPGCDERPCGDEQAEFRRSHAAI
ncbi:hypothetical protein [Methylocystis rosea]|uniref:hypothetical protein n=1 Tax=Methylocystis rosea TaxID=173366 RepID=UPI00197BAFA8|nr:hypothetical protein [Methylocystis rosea]